MRLEDNPSVPHSGSLVETVPSRELFEAILAGHRRTIEAGRRARRRRRQRRRGGYSTAEAAGPDAPEKAVLVERLADDSRFRGLSRGTRLAALEMLRIWGGKVKRDRVSGWFGVDLWPRIQTIASRLRVHRSTVCRWIRDLRSEGLLLVERTGRASRYLFVVPDEREVEIVFASCARCLIPATSDLEPLPRNVSVTTPGAQQSPGAGVAEQLLEQRGVSRGVVRRLVGAFPTARIAEVCRAFDLGSHGPGWIVEALRQKWRFRR